MKVLKFGGTSVGSTERIKHVASLVKDAGHNIVVLSAMAGTTNTLVEICESLYREEPETARAILGALESKYEAVISELYYGDDTRARAAAAIRPVFAGIEQKIPEPFTSAEEKEILACGELISTTLLHIYFQEQGVSSVLLPALDFMRTAEGGEPDMEYISEHLRRILSENEGYRILITQGYICRNAYGETDNLRRGGSDYSASIIGAVTGAEEIQIWTDIDGMHTGDPRYVKGTHPVKQLHFEEAAELAYFGAKILHPACVLPAKRHNIPVRLLNTMNPEAPGTLISNFPPDGTIKAIAAKDNITAIKVKSRRMLLSYSFLHQVFETFDKYHTTIDLITTSEVGVSLTMDSSDYVAGITEELKEFGTVSVDHGMVIICVVGDFTAKDGGSYCASVLDALKGLNVRMISFGGSNYNISVLVRGIDKVEALNRLNRHLFNK